MINCSIGIKINKKDPRTCNLLKSILKSARITSITAKGIDFEMLRSSDGKGFRKSSPSRSLSKAVKEELDSVRSMSSPAMKSSHRDLTLNTASSNNSRESRDNKSSAIRSGQSLPRRHGGGGSGGCSSTSDQPQGLDTSQQKMSLKHVTLPSVNVILASMPASPVAALQYLTCFLETAKKLKDEEKMREIQRQLDYIKLYLRQA
uniref:Uncharacterized protein n=1 Tax=Strigamia maritima TaxID=126957 RepID=T1JBY9_STRMM